MKRILIGCLVPCALAIASCNKEDAPKGSAKVSLTSQAGTDPRPASPRAPLRDKLTDDIPLPPSMPKGALAVPPAAADAPQQPGAAPLVHQGPTKGEDTPETLARAIVAAAKARNVTAFQELTVCGRDIALAFHKGVQVSLREKVALLSRKFITYTQQIPADGELLSFKAGFSADFQRGQGATVPMPGLLGSEITVKAGAVPKTLPLGRMVQVDKRWKLLDF